MLASLDPPYRDVEQVLAWLQALSWLGQAPDQDASNSCAAAAEALANDLMYGVAETFGQLVADSEVLPAVDEPDKIQVGDLSCSLLYEM